MASTRRDATVSRRVVPTQDYQQLSNIKKKFEPYFQLWDTADQWLSASKQWHSSSFVSLEAEQIETDTNNYKNAIQKAFKFFDRNSLTDQSQIAKEIKDQVKQFEPYVPIIVALRTRGMGRGTGSKLVAAWLGGFRT